MAIVPLNFTAVARMRLFRDQPAVPDRGTIPRGILTFYTFEQVPLQVAADQTHMLCTHEFPQEFAYRHLGYQLGVYSTSGVNNMQLDGMCGSPSGIRDDATQQDLEIFTLTGKFGQNATGAAAAPNVSCIWAFDNPPRGIIQKPESQNDSARLITKFTNVGGAEQPIMTFRESWAFMIYDLEQVENWPVHLQFPTISS